MKFATALVALVIALVGYNTVFADGPITLVAVNTDAATLTTNIVTKLQVPAEWVTVTAQTAPNTYLVTFTESFLYFELEKLAGPVLQGWGVTQIGSVTLGTPVPPGVSTPVPTTEQPPPLTYYLRIRQIEASIDSGSKLRSPLPSNCTATYLQSQQAFFEEVGRVALTYSVAYAVQKFGEHYGHLMDPIYYNTSLITSEINFALDFWKQPNASSYPAETISYVDQIERTWFSLRTTLALGAAVNASKWCFDVGESYIPTPVPTFATLPPIQIQTEVYNSIRMGVGRAFRQGTSGCPAWVFEPDQYDANLKVRNDNTIIADYYIAYNQFLPPNFVDNWMIWAAATRRYFNASYIPNEQDVLYATNFASVKTALSIFRTTLNTVLVETNYSWCFDMSQTLPPGFQEPMTGNSTLARYSQILYSESRLRANPFPETCPDFMKQVTFSDYMQYGQAVKDKTDAQIVSEYWSNYGSKFPEQLNQTKFLELVAIGKKNIGSLPFFPSDDGSLPMFSGDGPSVDSLPSSFPLFPSDFSMGSLPDPSASTEPPIPSGPSENFDPSQLGSGSWLPFTPSSQTQDGSGSGSTYTPTINDLADNAIAALEIMRQTLGWKDVVGAYSQCFNDTMLTFPPIPTDPPGLSPLTLDVQRYIKYQASLFRATLETFPAGSACPEWLKDETLINDYVDGAYANYSSAVVIDTYYLQLEPKLVAMYGGTAFDPVNLKAWEAETTLCKTKGDCKPKDSETYILVDEIVSVMRQTLGYYNLTVNWYPQCFGVHITEPPPTFEPGSGSGNINIGQQTNAILSRMYEIYEYETRPLINPLPGTCPNWMQNSTMYTEYTNAGTYADKYTTELLVSTYAAKYNSLFGEKGLNTSKILAELKQGQQIIANGGTGVAGASPIGSFPQSLSLPEGMTSFSADTQTHPSYIPQDALEAVAIGKVMRQTLAMLNSRTEYPQCFTNDTSIGGLLPFWHPDTTAYTLINQQYNREVKTDEPTCPAWIRNSTSFDEYLMTGYERLTDAEAISGYTQKFRPGLEAQDAVFSASAAIAWNIAAVKYFNGSAFSANGGFLLDKYQIVREAVQLFHIGFARANITEVYPQCFGAIITYAPTQDPNHGASGTPNPNQDYVEVVLSGQVRPAANPMPAPPKCPEWFQTKVSFDTMMQSGNQSAPKTDAQVIQYFFDTWGSGLPVNITVAGFTQSVVDAKAYAAANPNGGLGFQSLPSGASLPFGSNAFSGLPSDFGGTSSFSGSQLPGFSGGFDPSQLGSLPASLQFNSGSMQFSNNDNQKVMEYMDALTMFQTMRQAVGWVMAQDQYKDCFDYTVPTFPTDSTAQLTTTGTPAPIVTGTTPKFVTTPAPPTMIPPTPAPPSPVPATPVPPPTPAPTPLPPGATYAPPTPVPPSPVPPTPVPVTPIPPTPVPTPLPPGNTYAPPTPVPATPVPPTPVPTPLPPGQTYAPPTPVPPTPAPPTPAPTSVPFKAKLEPGKTEKDLEEKMKELFPDANITYTKLPNGEYEMVFNGDNAGVQASKLDQEKSKLASIATISGGASATDSPAAPAKGLGMGVIIGAVVGGIVVVIVLAAVVYKVTSGPKRGTGQVHEEYATNSANLQEELVTTHSTQSISADQV